MPICPSDSPGSQLLTQMMEAQVHPPLAPGCLQCPLGLLPAHWTALHQLGLDSGPELASPALWIWNLFLRSLALKPNSFKGL